MRVACARQGARVGHSPSRSPAGGGRVHGSGRARGARCGARRLLGSVLESSTALFDETALEPAAEGILIFRRRRERWLDDLALEQFRHPAALGLATHVEEIPAAQADCRRAQARAHVGRQMLRVHGKDLRARRRLGRGEVNANVEAGEECVVEVCPTVGRPDEGRAWLRFETIETPKQH